MMSYISTAIVGLIVIGVVFLAVRSLRKDQKAGKSLCGGGCGGDCACCRGSVFTDLEDYAEESKMNHTLKS